MELGQLRVDANVSVRPFVEGGDGGGVAAELGTRTEVKNLNSVRAVANAVEYEVSRQISVLESGGEVSNETLGFDAQQKVTLQMRDKEEWRDYRSVGGMGGRQ